MVGFREQLGHKQPGYSLVSLVFEKSTKLTPPYSSISVLPDRLPPDLAFGKHLARTSKVRLSNLNLVKIKQQERSYFRLLCFENQYLSAEPSLRCMLTHLSSILSIPVEPIVLSSFSELLNGEISFVH